VIPSTLPPHFNSVPNNAFNIEVFNHLRHPSFLWSDTGDSRMMWRGMVTIEHVYQRILGKSDYMSNSGILYQTVRCIVDTTTSLLRDLPKTLSVPDGFPLANSGPSYRPITMYPSDVSLNASLAKFAQCCKVDVDASAIPKLEPGQRLDDIPLIADYLKQRKCRCGPCDVSDTRKICLDDDFAASVVQIALNVITFALFDWTEPIFVHGPETQQYFEIGTFVFDLYYGRSLEIFEMHKLFSGALRLVGHKSNANLKSWIATGQRGQVAYLKAFDTMELRDDGVFCLGGGPGKLSHEGMSYSSVLAAPSSTPSSLGEFEVLDIPVDRILNCFVEKRLNWHISKFEEFLWLSWNVTGRRRMDMVIGLLQTLERSILVSNCPHPETSILPDADQGCQYITLPQGRLSYQGDKTIVVVPVAGDNALRLFSFLAMQTEVVVGGNRACLACCLDVCRRTETWFLIL
jgi:hypothetical protein